MFGKKKTPSLSPYNLQVLTTEYLIDGTVDGSSDLYIPKLNVIIQPLILTAVKIQTTRPADVPVRTCNQFAFIGGNTVALIPRVNFQLLPRYVAWKEYKYPVQGIFYFGVYKVEGRLMILREGLFSDETPAYDVHITSMIPGTYWGEIFAPFAVLNTNWLHGFEIT